MTDRFERFTTNIAMAYKSIIKIKAYFMKEYDLKASNVMCLFYTGKSENGVTAGELCDFCHEDKAAVSKSLTELKYKKYIR